MIIKADKLKGKNIGEEAWIEIKNTCEVPIKILEKHENTVKTGTGTAKIVKPQMILEVLEDAGECLGNIKGIIVPLPEFLNEYIWSASLEKCLKAEFGKRQNLYDLFSKDVFSSKIRTKYFELAEKYVFKKYIKPLVDFSKKHKLRLCFDLTNCELETDLTEHFIDIFRLKEVAADILISDSFLKNFLVSSVGNARVLMKKKRTIKELNRTNCEKKILFVAASNGAKSLTYKRKKAKIHLELPNTLICAEVCYHCDRIVKSGYELRLCSEKQFENKAVITDGEIEFLGEKFSEIFICNDCLFNDSGEELLAKIIERSVIIKTESDFLDLE